MERMFRRHGDLQPILLKQDDGRVEGDDAIAVSAKPMSPKLEGRTDRQLPLSRRTSRTTARPADSPIMARRPFQISA